MLGGFLEQRELQAAEAVVRTVGDLAALEFFNHECSIVEWRYAQFRVVVAHRVERGHPREGGAEVDLVALVGHDRGSQHFLRDGAKQGFGEVHQVAVIPVGLVELDHGEFRVMPCGDPFVAKAAIDLEDLFQAADHQALEVQLRRDAQE